MSYEYVQYEVQGPVATITLSIAQRRSMPFCRSWRRSCTMPWSRRRRSRRAGFCSYRFWYCILRRVRHGVDERISNPLDPTGKSIGDYIEYWWNLDSSIVQKLMNIWLLAKPVIAGSERLRNGRWVLVSDRVRITIASERAVLLSPKCVTSRTTTFLFAALCGWKAANRYALPEIISMPKGLAHRSRQ